jgi:hypothetical protein
LKLLCFATQISSTLFNLQISLNHFLVKINSNIDYKTNKWYKKDGKEMIYDGEFVVSGSSIEFKFTLLEGNKYAGSYTYTFVPCTERTDNCRCEVAYKNMPAKVYPWLSFCRDNNTKTTTKGYEYSDTDHLAEFVKANVINMIEDLKR